MVRGWIAIGIAVMLGAHPTDTAVADELLSVQASPPLGPAPGVVRLLVRVEPDAANRSLIVEVNSFAMYRSSLITLDGESAQAAYWLEFNSLPAGLYSVTVALRRVDGERATAQDTFTVVP